MAANEARPSPESQPMGDGAAPGSQAPCPLPWCPLCVAASVVQPLHPEVVDHLIKAGTELLMAVRAVVDAGTGQADGAEGKGAGATRLEKIELG
jgi:hypothetical protein